VFLSFFNNVYVLYIHHHVNCRRVYLMYFGQKYSLLNKGCNDIRVGTKCINNRLRIFWPKRLINQMLDSKHILMQSYSTLFLMWGLNINSSSSLTYMILLNGKQIADKNSTLICAKWVSTCYYLFSSLYRLYACLNLELSLPFTIEPGLSGMDSNVMVDKTCYIRFQFLFDAYRRKNDSS